jgi:hypothetical protein
MSVSCDKPLWLDEDEWHLARLCCVKFAKQLQGMLSIGLSALVTGIPDPASFFPDCFQVLDSHAIVLHTISGHMGASEQILRLRRQSASLRDGLRLLQQVINSTIANRANGQQVALDLIGQAATAVCDQLTGYASLIGIALPLVGDIKLMTNWLVTSLLTDPTATS